jgi:hypothetical protein
MTYATDSGTTGQGQNNSSQLSTPIQWHKTTSCTFYITCTSQTMTKKLTITTKTMTDLGKSLYAQRCVFQIFQPFWIFGNWQGDSTFQREGCIQTVYSKETQMIRNENFQTLWCRWLHMTATHVTVKQLTRRVKGRGHKLYMDNYFSSLDLYNDLTEQKINCCSTVRPNRKGRPDDFRSKTVILKRGDVRARTNGA